MDIKKALAMNLIDEKIRKFCIFLIRLYQKFISPLFGSSCRFYPTCSEFAYLQFCYNNFFVALWGSFFRILRCNKFFKGGFDYPLVKKTIEKSCIFVCEKNFKFWLIPYKSSKFYLVKNLKYKGKS